MGQTSPRNMGGDIGQPAFPQSSDVEDNSVRISEEAKRCDDLFKALVSRPNAASVLVAERLQYRFQQWTLYLGVYATKNRSLDTRLKHCDGLRKLILQPLATLCSNLDIIVTLETGQASNADVTDEQRRIEQEFEHAQDSAPSSPYLGPLKRLNMAIDGLYRIGAAIRQPSPACLAERDGRYASGFEEATVGELAFIRLKAKFVQIDTRKGARKSPLSLYRQLAASISFRYIELLHQRNCHKKLDTHSQVISYPSRAEKCSTDANPREIVEGIDYPEIPKVDLKTGLAQCYFCYASIPADLLEKESWWQTHLEEDLKLYPCLAEACSEIPQLFTSYDEWIEHMYKNHSADWMYKVHEPIGWVCDYQHEDIWFDDEQDFNKHIEVHHTELKDDETEIKKLQHWGKIRRERALNTCLICNMVPGNIKPCSKDTRNQVIEHIGGHLKQLGWMSVFYLEKAADNQLPDGIIKSFVERKDAQFNDALLHSFEIHQFQFGSTRPRLLTFDADFCLSFVPWATSRTRRYSILSHTWGPDDEEVSFEDVFMPIHKRKLGYEKIRFCGERARRDSIEYFWIDTCCINKSNTAELSTAINSMFKWYQNAAKCYVLLSDVSAGEDFGESQLSWESSFRRSRWFTRGWTLQELLAPSTVEFFSKEGIYLGSKKSLELLICEITGIPRLALQGYPMSYFSVSERLSWMKRRQTTIEEDEAYALLGILEVNLPVLYGEGAAKAFSRLQDEVDKHILSTTTTGLCLLSLDGGVVRGLSALYILKGIMDRLNEKRKQADLPKVEPYEHFDLIGGIGTGGLIAIMLGRLGMTIDECITAFGSLMEATICHEYTIVPGAFHGVVDQKNFETTLRKIIAQRSVSDTALFNNGVMVGCKTFVCAFDRSTGGPVRLRDYCPAGNTPNSDLTICDAVLATLAVSSIFDPIRVGGRVFCEGTVTMNPIQEVEDEAASLWSSKKADLRPLLSCFVSIFSIGAGYPGKPISMHRSLGMAVVQAAADTDMTEKQFVTRSAKSFDHKRSYFRFNVEDGLQDIGLNEYTKRDALIEAVREYLNHPLRDLQIHHSVQQILEVKHGKKTAAQQVVSHNVLGECQPQLMELSPVTYISNQNLVTGRRTVETCQWLLNSTAFSSWLNQKQRALYCYGSPGVGKTILTSVVIDYLQENFSNNEDIAIAYIYINSWEQYRRGILDILRCILLQIINKRGRLSDDHQINRRPRDFSYLVLKELQSYIRSFSRTYIIVDALDEFRAADGTGIVLLDALLEIKSVTGANLFMTSNKITEYIVRLRGMDDTSTSMEILATEEDIKRYTKERMYQVSTSILTKEETLSQEIVRCITKAADGLFLLAKFHMDSVVREESVMAIRGILRNLPCGADAYDYYYDIAMRRIAKQPTNMRSLALKILSWTLLAKRPLKVVELQHALAVDESTGELNSDNIPPVESLISACAGLVTVSLDTVQPLHYTTERYLRRTFETWAPTAKRNIATTCVRYLLNNRYSGAYMRSLEVPSLLLQYALLNWGYHVAEAPETQQQLVIKLLDSIESYIGTTYLGFRLKGFSDTGPVNKLVAAYFKIGLPTIDDTMQGWINHGIRENQDLLELAAIIGNELIAKGALARGCRVDTRDYPGLTPLMYAALGGHAKVVELLLKYGARLDDKLMMSGRHFPFRETEIVPVFRDDYYNGKPLYLGDTALSMVAVSGRVEMMAWILKLLKVASHNDLGRSSSSFHRYEAGVDLKSDKERTPLFRAAEVGRAKMVELLLDAGADIESKDISGRTPLFRAAQEGHDEVVKVLLSRGADANAKDDRGSLPLVKAVDKGHYETVALLLDKGADINAEDSQANFPLLQAAERGHTRIVELLLEKGAQVDAHNNSGRCPLLQAADQGHSAVVQCLLDAGADINSGEGHRRPIIAAALAKKLEALRVLIGKGAEPSCIMNISEFLAVSLDINRARVIDILLDRRGVEVDYQDAAGRTALSHAAEGNLAAVIELLLHQSAGSKPKNPTCHFPLSYEDMIVYYSEVKRMLDQPIDLNSTIPAGRRDYISLLRFIMSFNMENVLEAMFNYSVKMDEGRDSVPPHRLFGNRHFDIDRALDIAERLLNRGAQADSKDYNGRTPLSYSNGTYRYRMEALFQDKGFQ